MPMRRIIAAYGEGLNGVAGVGLEGFLGNMRRVATTGEYYDEASTIRGPRN